MQRLQRISDNPLKRSMSVVAIALLAFAILFGVTLATRAVSAQSGQAGDKGRLVTIYDRGQERTVYTHQPTIGAALAEAGVAVDKNDTVEPAQSEELVATSYTVNIYRARPVTVVDGVKRERIVTANQTATQIAKDANVTLYDEDKTELTRSENMVSDGASLELKIDRATPFTLVLYGKPTEARTQATTVADMLKEKNISLGANDQVSVAASTAITAGMTVELWRNGKQTITEEQDVNFQTEVIKDADRDPSYKEIKEAGEKGKRTVTYEVVVKNGKEESRVEIQSVTIKEAKKQVEIVGSKLPTPTSPTEAQALGRQMMIDYGFADSEWPCLYNLWMRESGWKTSAHNASSGAHGIPQALPGSKMGPGWESDARVQIQWGLGYIKGRYKTPCGAWDFFLAKNWY